MSSPNYTSFLPKTTFTKVITCFAPTLTINSFNTGDATASWTPSGHGETQYQYVLKRQTAGAPTDAEWAAATPYTGTNVVLNGLDAYVYYTLYLRSYCAADDQSPAVSASFETSPWPDSVVARGTTTNNYLPIYGGYVDDPVGQQSIYPADMLTDLIGQTFTGLHYFVASGGGVGSSNSWGDTKPMKVKMKVVTESSLSSFLNVDDATTVFDGTLLGSEVNTTNG
ncbi:MAG: hypothetical protein IJQ14_02490, partial [Bacteroidales bacterium]|nr:hypothetical protein [Bacteroidales bacterium]